MSFSIIHLKSCYISASRKYKLNQQKLEIVNNSERHSGMSEKTESLTHFQSYDVYLVDWIRQAGKHSAYLRKLIKKPALAGSAAAFWLPFNLYYDPLKWCSYPEWLSYIHCDTSPYLTHSVIYLERLRRGPHTTCWQRELHTLTLNRVLTWKSLCNVFIHIFNHNMLWFKVHIWPWTQHIRKQCIKMSI